MQLTNVGFLTNSCKQIIEQTKADAGPIFLFALWIGTMAFAILCCWYFICKNFGQIKATLLGRRQNLGAGGN
jgi:hypothetical protein